MSTAQHKDGLVPRGLLLRNERSAAISTGHCLSGFATGGFAIWAPLRGLVI